MSLRVLLPVAALLVGFLGSFPLGARGGALVLAEMWYSLGGWQQVDRYYRLHQRLGGRPAPQLLVNWHKALMNLQRWADAERALLETVRMEGGRAITSPQTGGVAWWAYTGGIVEDKAASQRSATQLRSSARLSSLAVCFLKQMP